jgi:arylsulfatase A-like enzyme
MLITLLLAAAAPAPTGHAAPPPQERPNILIILTDDQPAQRDAYEVMPKTMQAFRKGGMKFRNGVVTTPLCCPSRASILSGQYVHNHGVTTNETGGGHALDASHTIQATLQDNDYLTAFIGKYLNGLNQPAYFDRWATFEAETPSYIDAPFNVDGDVVTSTGYSTTFMKRQSLRVLGDFESSDSRPWFLEIAPNAPHKPATPQRKYADAPVPRWSTNPARREKDLTDKPDFIAALATDDRSAVKRQRKNQLRALMSVDDLVGAVFSRLEETGEADNTLAFFLSDNGYFWHEHRLPATKRLPYDESVRVPFFVRWPGHISAGAVETKVVANIDIAPTVYEAVGVAPDYVVDGQSLFGSQRTEVFLEYLKDEETPRYPKWYALWSPASAYIRYYESDGRPREYYEAGDRWQLENVYRDGIPNNEPEDEAARDALLKQYATCAGTACP